PQHVLDWDLAITEEDLRRFGSVVAQFVEILPNRETGGALFDHQDGHAAMPGLRLGICLDEHGKRIGVTSVGDPGLCAVDDVVIANSSGDGGDTLQVAACLRLSQSDAGPLLATGEIRQPPSAADRADALAGEVAHQVAERSLLIR